MGKQDNIYEKGNLSGLPFTFNEEVTEVFEDMIKRSVPGYKTSLDIIKVPGVFEIPVIISKNIKKCLNL